jgi:hypothetical protein
MKYRPLPRRALGRFEDVDVLRRAADLLEVAQGLFLDGGQTPFDIALGGLAVGQVVGLVGEDHVVLIGLPHLVPALADLFVDRAFLADVLGPGDLGGLAEEAGDAFGQELVIHVAHGGAGAEAGGGVALAALGRHPKLGDRAFLALHFGGQCTKSLAAQLAARMVSKSPFCSIENSATSACRSRRMPSAIFLVQPGSMPITTTECTLGLAPVPIMVRKCSSRSSPNCSRP